MKNKKKIILLILILAVILGFSHLTSFARYGSNYVWNYYLESHGFYLNSDSLGLDKKNTDTLWDGSSVHFGVKNYSNNDLITDIDIRYTVICEVLNDDPYTCKLNGTNSSTLNLVLSSNSHCVNNTEDLIDVSEFGKSDCEIGGYSWQSFAVNQDVYFDVFANNNADINNARIKITVSSTSPYRKTITGIFNLFKNTQNTGEIIKQIYDNELYDELVVTNSYDIRKCVEISFNTATRIVEKDNNMINPIADSNGYIESFKILLDGKSNKVIKFYNKDFTDNYSQDDFTVIESNGCF